MPKPLEQEPPPLPEPVPAPPPRPKLRERPTAPPDPSPAPEPAPVPDDDVVFLPVPRPAPPPLIPPPQIPPPMAPLPVKDLSGGGERGSLLDRVMGQGAPSALGIDLPSLEGALDFRAPGPMSDKERGERAVTGYLKGALAQHDVRRGLADDYFRRFGKVIERQWRPQKGELNDGGKAVSQLGILQDFLLNPARWGEYYKLYVVEVMAPMMAAFGLDHTLRHVPDPSAPTMAGQRELSPDELQQKLLEELGTRKQALRFSASARLRVFHDDKGRVMAIEVLASSGHPRLDDGMRQALERAAAALSEDAPPGVAAGRPFTSEWLLDARWQMTPPRCYAMQMGGGPPQPIPEDPITTFQCAPKWDITRDGLEVERPFEVKLHTEARLLEVQPAPEGGAAR